MGRPLNGTLRQQADLRTAFTRFRDRLRADRVADNVERGLLGSTFVLCGLRYDQNQIDTLYRELSMTLEDSTTYQLILNRGLTRGREEGRAEGRTEGRTEGRVEEARALVLLLGGKRFGPAPAATESAVRGIADRERLERIAARLIDATGWDDLLATP